MEIWKKIVGYSDYEVSNLGRVKSLKYGKERILKQRMGGTGYLNVVFYIDNKAKNYNTHKLVAIAFLDHTPCGYDMIVDHIDNDKLNNKLTNLQIITSRMNTSKDRFRINYTSRYVGVYLHKKSNRWMAKIMVNYKRKYLGYFKSEIEASEAYQKALKELVQI